MPDSDFTPVKQCSKCLETKLKSEFFKATNGKDGLHGACKTCIKAAQQAYQVANREKIATQKASYRKANQNKIKASRAANAHKHKDNEKTWRDANQDHIKAYRVTYWSANKERLTAENAVYRAKKGDQLRSNARAKYKETYDPDQTWAKLNPERNKETVAAWRAANPELRIIWELNRRARKRSTGGRLSSGLTEKLHTLQKGKCPCCKHPLGDDFHLDHVAPLARGGLNVDSNMQLLRAVCNLNKSAKDPLLFMQSRGFLL